MTIIISKNHNMANYEEIGHMYVFCAKRAYSGFAGGRAPPVTLKPQHSGALTLHVKQRQASYRKGYLL